MRNVLFFFVVLYFIPGCGSTSKLTKFTSKWLIDSTTANAMIRSYTDCQETVCRSSIEFKVKDKVYRRLVRLYPTATIVPVDARYRKEDVPRYRRNHGIGENNPKGDVAGYTTKLLKFTIPSNAPSTSSKKFRALRFADMDLHFDVGQICPPPQECME